MNAITSLPTKDHEGNSTLDAVYAVLGALRAGWVLHNITPGCKGFWYDGDDLYVDDTIVIHLSGRDEVIKRALARFGEDAEQYEVLLVQQTEGYVVEVGYGEEGAARLAKVHGGATLFASGTAVAYRYTALVHGRDYVSTVTGAVV